MLYLIYGNDRQKVVAKSADLVAGLKKRKPDAEIFTMAEDNFDVSKLQALAGGQGLFESKFVVVLKNLFSRKENTEKLSEILPALAVSPNIFLFVEGAFSEVTVRVFEKNAAHIQKYTMVRAERQPNFFALADALALRDKKRLWVLYVAALRKGASPEEISGILFWKIKDMFSPAGRGKFSPDDLRSTASKLLQLYHDAHRGLVDFETGLERFILSV